MANCGPSPKANGRQVWALKDDGRAVVELERFGTAEARQFFESWPAEAAAAGITREARGLERLTEQGGEQLLVKACTSGVPFKVNS